MSSSTVLHHRTHTLASHMEGWVYRGGGGGWLVSSSREGKTVGKGGTVAKLGYSSVSKISYLQPLTAIPVL